MNKTEVFDETITITIPRQAGLVFQLENLPGTDVWVVVIKGEINELIEKARLWDKEKAGRLFWCDQCDYFNTSAEAVQRHSEEEHDCRFETYETVDRFGVSYLRVRTVKCHPRVTKKDELRSVHKELDRVVKEARRAWD
jgi:hypothetical protein